MLKITIANNTDIEQCYEIRKHVFCVEQGVEKKIERDGLDEHATHVLATFDGIPIGCCRLFFENNSAHVGRLAVKKHCRRQGIGKAILQFVIALATERRFDSIWLNAQLHSVDFYKKLGFQPVGDVFVEADIEHVKMVKRLL